MEPAVSICRLVRHCLTKQVSPFRNLNDLALTSGTHPPVCCTLSRWGRSVKAPWDRDKCLTAWFCVQPHVLSAHHRLINITGSPVIPHSALLSIHSSCYTFTTSTAGHFQQGAVVSIRPQSKLDSVWESVIMCLCLPAGVAQQKHIISD